MENNEQNKNEFFLFNPTMEQPHPINENSKSIKTYYDYR